MPRKPRLHLPGGLYYVFLRGNDRQDIFFEDEHRSVFYRLLDEGTRRFGYRVHAFCLMSNHVHLALQMGPQPLSKGLQNLSLRYTRHINRSQGRVCRARTAGKQRACACAARGSGPHRVLCVQGQRSYRTRAVEGRQELEWLHKHAL